VALAVRISEPALLDELLLALARHGCVAHRIDVDSCRVVHVHARDADEARRELGFFLGAWELEHPSVTARLSTRHA
jgi:hypothetical protein